MFISQHLIPFITLALSPLVRGYVPTTPSPNAPSGSNVSPATLVVRTPPSAALTMNDVVRVQTGITSPHPFAGAFVQYDQAFFRQPVFTNSVTTPWVAFVPCDQNVTDVTTDVLNDIDNLRGATSVVFYSVTSESCTLNPSDSGKELDIYVTTKSATAKLILSQFSSLSDAKFAKFDADLLNQNGAAVQSSLAQVSGPITSPFVMAVFQVGGSGGNTSGPVASSTPTGASPSSTGGSSTTGGGYSYAPGTGTGTTKPASAPTNAAVGVLSSGSIFGIALSFFVSLAANALA